MYKIFIFLIGLVNSRKFEFKIQRYITEPDNWVLNRTPCTSDSIDFATSSGYTVAYIDEILNATQIYLPDNGVLIFNDPVALGDTASWQCFNEDFREELQFEANIGPSFHDPANWKENEEEFLHMNQIPSIRDTVIFPDTSAIQVSLEKRVTVNQFNYYGRMMTTDDMTKVIRTMEGQFQFLLVNNWAHENDRGNIQRMLADDPIIILNDDKLNEKVEGIINPNAENETLQLICRYVQCVPVDCVEPFQPHGHCCPVCGARATFYAKDLDFNTTLQQATKLMVSNGYVDTHYVSLERVEMISVSSKYELLVVPKPSIKNKSYREESFDWLVNAIMQNLKKNSNENNSRSSIYSLSINVSRTNRTIQWYSKLIGIAIYLMIIVVVIGAYLYNTQAVRPKLPASFAPIIYWKKSQEDVRVELEVEAEVLGPEVEVEVREPEAGAEKLDAVGNETSEVENESTFIELVEVPKTDILNEEESCNPNFEVESEDSSESEEQLGESDL